MRQAIFLWWLGLFFLVVFGLPKAVFAQGYPDESEAGCYQILKNCSSGNAEDRCDPSPPDYTDVNKNTRPEVRSDAGFDLTTSVVGAYCGEVKSSPIVLEEKVSYPGPAWNDCTIHPAWGGEIQMNYNFNTPPASDPNVNLKIPFAEEIADEWAGTLDTEQLTPQAFDDLMGRASGLALTARAANKYSSGSTGTGSSSNFIVPADVSLDPQYNLDQRGYRAVNEPKTLTQYGYPSGEAPDPQAPQLGGIVNSDLSQNPNFSNVYRVQEPGGSDSPPWKVSSCGLSCTPGQAINTPAGGHDAGGFTQMVVYASPTSLTLVNGNADNPIDLYTTNIDGITVDPALLAQYNAANASGRNNNLPRLGAQQPVGTCSGSEVRVAIRDSGQFMDCRSKGDWWQNSSGQGIHESPYTTLGINQGGGTAANTQDMLAAASEVNKRAGVLRKLLPMDQQDELKCNFANWVAKRHNQSPQLPTMYVYYQPDGKVFLPLLGGEACRNVACPISDTDRAKCLTNYDNGTKQFKDPYGNSYSPGPAWQKMPLIPNEKSRGVIKYFVCGDKRYDTRPDYPEVMRLGLSANELFRIFTDKTTQDRFYAQYPDLAGNPLANLMLPVNQRPKPKTNVPQSSTITPASVILGNPKGDSRMTRQTKPSYFSQLVSFIQKYWPKVQIALAKTVEKYKTKAPVLLAQAPVKEITVTPQTKLDNGQLQFNATITAPVDGHIFTEIWIDGQKAGGTVNAVRAGQTLVYGTPGMAPGGADIYAPLSGDHKIEFKVKCDDCNIPGQQGQEIWAGCTVAGGVCTPISYPISTGTDLAGKCDSNVSCCVTADCGPITPLPKTQVGPSYTTVWPKGYPGTHLFLGAKDYSTSEIFDDPIVYSFKPTKADCQFTPITEIIDGKEFSSSCSGEDTPCDGGVCHEDENGGGKCGTWTCGRTHDRVINVYNNVPFLASTWKQAADPVWGFMSAIKPLGITGSGVIPDQQVETGAKGKEETKITDFTGCTDDQNLLLDQFGNYVPEHASAPIYYGFRQMADFKNNADKIEVNMKGNVHKTDKDGNDITVDDNGKILYYRLAGTCNANKWWTEKVLNPMLGAGLTSSGVGKNANIIAACIQTNGSINPDKFYDTNDNCKDYGGEPSCCSRMGSGEYAKECDWTERRRCTLESCALIPDGQSKERCGQLVEVGWLKKGSEILQGK